MEKYHFKCSNYIEHKIFPVRIKFCGVFLHLLNDYSMKVIILSVVGNAKISKTQILTQNPIKKDEE